MERAAAHNLLVLLDMHRLDDQSIPMLWFNEEYGMDDVIRGWDTVLGDMQQHWNGAYVYSCRVAIDRHHPTQTPNPNMINTPTQSSAWT